MTSTTPPDPDDFKTNADHDGEMDLSCPACRGWWVEVPQGSTIRQQRQLALDHIADKHSAHLAPERL